MAFLSANTEYQQKNATHVPAANTAAVVSLPATTSIVHSLMHIDCGYSEAPAAGSTLVIAFGSVTVWSMPILASGAAPPFDWPSGFDALIGQAVTVTLAAGGGTAVGSLNVLYR